MHTDMADTKWYSYTSSTQTTKSWVRRVTSFEEVPPAFHSAFPAEQAPFPYTLFLPEEQVLLSETRNRQIVCVYEDHLVHVELVGNETKTTVAKFADVLYLEQGKILLHSWLKIVTEFETLWIKFNTVNDILFVTAQA